MTVAEIHPATPALVLAIPEAAALLRCGRSTVYELLANRELTGLKIGRRRLVTHDSIRDYVARQIQAGE